MVFQMWRTQNSQSSLVPWKELSTLGWMNMSPSFLLCLAMGDSRSLSLVLEYDIYSIILQLTDVSQGARTSVKEEKPNALPFPDPFTQFEEFAKTEQVRLAASPAATRVKKKSPKPLTSEERDWLTAKVQAMEGFETFQKQHGQRLNNLNRVLYWKFAANFTQKYYKTEWPILSIEHEHSVRSILYFLQLKLTFFGIERNSNQKARPRNYSRHENNGAQSGYQHVPHSGEMLSWRV